MGKKKKKKPTAKGATAMSEIETKPLPVFTRFDPGMMESMLEVLHTTGDALPEVVEKPLTIILGREGISTVHAYKNYNIMRTPKTPLMVKLHRPLPWVIYARMVGLFKAVETKMGAEALCYVWAKADGSMEFTVPEQEVSKAAADPDDKEMTPPPGDGWDLWGHVHSHNTMPPFFSGTDNASEQQDGLVYGVVGHITKQIPESKWRIRANGQWAELNFEHVVEIPTTVYPAPRAEWMERIKPKSARRELSLVGGGITRMDGKDGIDRELRQAFFSHRPLVDRAIGNYFTRLIRLDGSIWMLWADDHISPTGKRFEDLTQKERRLCKLEGVDWKETR